MRGAALARQAGGPGARESGSGRPRSLQSLCELPPADAPTVARSGFLVVASGLAASCSDEPANERRHDHGQQHPRQQREQDRPNDR